MTHKERVCISRQYWKNRQQIQMRHSYFLSQKCAAKGWREGISSTWWS